jgi:hypothetical protein
MVPNSNLSRKEREIELRKQIIVEAAEKLFLSKGYDNTTMDEIAYESEFSKGTLYNYFQSKDELYLVIAIKAYEKLIEYTQKFTSKVKPGLEQMKAIGFAYYEFSKDYPKYAHIFHDVALKVPEIGKKPKSKLTSIEATYLKIGEDYGKIFKDVLLKAMKNKTIRSDKDPFMIGVILSSVTGGIIKELIQHKEDLNEQNIDVDDAVDFLFEILGEGLKPR